MSKKYTVLGIFLALLLSTSSVSAQSDPVSDPTAVPTSTKVRPTRPPKTQVTGARRTSQSATRPAELKITKTAEKDAAKRQRANEFFGKMSERFQAALDRLTLLSDRVESRLDKLDEEGANTQELRSLLSDARSELSAASTALEDAKAKFDEIINSQTPQQYFKQIKPSLETTKNHLRNAHSKLVEIITQSQGLRVAKPTRSATVTPTL